MAGDVGFEERAIVLTGPTAKNTRIVASAVQQAHGRVTHHYGPRVVIGEVSPDTEYSVRAAISEAAVVDRMAAIPPDVIKSLDPIGLLGLQAFDLRQSKDYATAKDNRPHQGETWDFGGDATAPDLPPGLKKLVLLEAPAAGKVCQSSSARLSGDIVVGIIVVSGPTDDLQFTVSEKIQVLAEVQQGLSWLGSQSLNGHVSWFYDVQSVSIKVEPNPNAPNLEALWRDPTMVALGFSGDLDGVKDYVQNIRDAFKTDWTYCAFFTKYKLIHFAYENNVGPRVVMNYSNGTWGPDNIDRIFAHETGHIFKAPDEYKKSKCNCVDEFGYFQIRNGNCSPCVPDNGVPCIMRENTWAMCSFTPWHLGFTGFFPNLFFQGAPGNGIGGYDLLNAADQAFAFDFDRSGTLDHLVLYRPGAGKIYILKNTAGTFSAVFKSETGGIGGYDLLNAADRAFAFDFDRSGKLDHLVLYRPGAGKIYILKNTAGTFSAVFKSETDGIGTYTLLSTADRAFAFDFNSSGKLDHLVLYRPGRGKIFILQNGREFFRPVFKSETDGIGTYSLLSTADRAFAFDFNGSGTLDHLVLYRPGAGKIYILKRDIARSFSAVFKSETGGIGGYDLLNAADQAFAFDFNGTCKSDHLVLYRPGQRVISILMNGEGTFPKVFTSNNGIDGWDLGLGTDRGFTFDYLGKGALANLVFYRPGDGAIAILDDAPATAPSELQQP